MKKKSAKEQILKHLQSGKSLTPLSCFEWFGTMRLGARVWDLRREGHNIKAEPCLLPSGKIVSRYSMGKE